jgi:hypothetical protein
LGNEAMGQLKNFDYPITQLPDYPITELL